jgi:hypothetical protein
MNAHLAMGLALISPSLPNTPTPQGSGTIHLFFIGLSIAIAIFIAISLFLFGKKRFRSTYMKIPVYSSHGELTNLHSQSLNYSTL